ncbi:MAG: S1 RNA-binding domain-containing protein [bacterium]|nr:S1 RNA-binding domain-containing protein [bacterium]
MEVYKLGASCDYSDVQKGKIYVGKVSRIEKYGVFINLNPHVRGLIKRDWLKNKRVTDFKIGQTVYVRVLDVRPEKGEIDLEEVEVREPVKIKEIQKPLKRTLIKDIYTNPDFDKIYKIIGIVQRIQQTPGPTVFFVTDESDSIQVAAMSELGPGFRAYPEIVEGDLVEVIGKLNIHENCLQLLASEMKKLDVRTFSEIYKAIESYLDALSEPPPLKPSVKSEVLEKLWPQIRKAAKLIKKAILENRPILIRHHGDCDGYAGALALERAIVSLLKEKNPDPEAEWHYFKRFPTRVPYYHPEDLAKDMDAIQEDIHRFGHKKPLIIVLDNGSTLQDVPVYKQLRTLGFNIIVIDHHEPDMKDKQRSHVDDYVDVHINPYLVGGDSNITAGMLGFELARLINPRVEKEISHLPAIAGIADKSEAEELKEYLKFAKAKGYDEEFLKKVGEVVDYIAFNLKFKPGRYYIDYFFGLHIDKGSFVKLINQLYSMIRSLLENYKRWTSKYLITRRLDNGIFVVFIDAEKYMFRSDYPNPGKASSIIKEYLEEKYGKDTPLILVAHGPDFAIIRATEALELFYNFNIKQLINYLISKYPWAQVSGGGHKIVGTLKFLEGFREQVLAELVNYLSRLKRK